MIARVLWTRNAEFQCNGSSFGFRLVLEGALVECMIAHQKHPHFRHLKTSTTTLIKYQRLVDAYDLNQT